MRSTHPDPWSYDGTDPDACFEAGEALAPWGPGAFFPFGDGTADAVAAQGWFEHAAALGHVGAHYALGRLSESAADPEVRNTFDAARTHYQRAADQGHVRAMVALGALHFGLSSGPRNLAAARGWYEQAATAGGPETMAEICVGLMTAPRKESHAPGRLAEAQGWAQRAAEAGLGAGHRFLGYLANTEAEVPNAQVARAHFERAWAMGDVQALCELAGLYAYGGCGGDGPIDRDMALHYYRLAAEHGSEGALEFLSHHARLGEKVWR